MSDEGQRSFPLSPAGSVARKGGLAMMVTRHSSTSARGPGGESFSCEPVRIEAATRGGEVRKYSRLRHDGEPVEAVRWACGLQALVDMGGFDEGEVVRVFRGHRDRDGFVKAYDTFGEAKAAMRPVWPRQAARGE